MLEHWATKVRLRAHFKIHIIRRTKALVMHYKVINISEHSTGSSRAELHSIALIFLKLEEQLLFM